MSVCDNFQILLLCFSLFMLVVITGFVTYLSKLPKWNTVLMSSLTISNFYFCFFHFVLLDVTVYPIFVVPVSLFQCNFLLRFSFSIQIRCSQEKKVICTAAECELLHPEKYVYYVSVDWDFNLTIQNRSCSSDFIFMYFGGLQMTKCVFEMCSCVTRLIKHNK